MSQMGHERPGRAGSGSGHVRCAPKATVGHENAIRRLGAMSELLPALRIDGSSTGGPKIPLRASRQAEAPFPPVQ